MSIPLSCVLFYHRTVEKVAEVRKKRLREQGLSVTIYKHLLWTQQRSKAEGEYEYEKGNSSGIPSRDGEMHFLRRRIRDWFNIQVTACGYMLKLPSVLYGTSAFCGSTGTH